VEFKCLVCASGVVAVCLALAWVVLCKAALLIALNIFLRGRLFDVGDWIPISVSNGDWACVERLRLATGPLLG